MKIKAAVVREKAGPFLIEEIDLDEPRVHEVLVRIVGCGLCHTDLAVRDQHLPTPLPAVFGHEGAGVVEKVGSAVQKVQPGDHVVMSYFSDGTCPSCKKGAPTHCSSFPVGNFSGARLDGSTTMRKGAETIHGSFFSQSSFASHALANERNVVKVASDLPLEKLGPLGCGIMTGAGGVINSLKARPGSSIAVFGAGSVGVSAIMGAVVSGCTTIIAVDINDGRLEVALGFGATHTINSSTTDPVQKIQEITGGGVEYALECTGIPKVLRQGFEALATGGACGLIGAAPVGSQVTIDTQTILSGGRILRGVIMGDSIPDIFIPQLIDFYRAGRFPFDRMITFYPMDQINQAAEDSEKGKALKAVLRP
ncbi:MAG: NAD(P)-dependent alcohol dehydrogenase [Syntrophorhabdales bacterium]|jgi:aryl-alcohol dehydrogenase